MQRYRGVVRDLDGTAIENATITVRIHGTQTSASLFSDPFGATSLSNPLSSGASGDFLFCAEDGLYDLIVQDDLIGSVLYERVQLFDLSAFRFNVRSFGAVGDGATDDSAAIQAAIDAAEAASGGVVEVPPGYYRIESGLTIESDGVILRGSGPGGENLTSKAAVLAPGALMTEPMLTIGTTSGVTRGSGVEDINFNYGGSYNCIGMIALMNAQSCFVTRSTLHMNAADANDRAVIAIDTSGANKSTNCRIEDCYIHMPRVLPGNIGGYGYGITISNSGSDDCTAHMIRGCKFFNGCATAGTPIMTQDDVGGNFISDCHIGGNSVNGIAIGGTGGGDTMVNVNIDTNSTTATALTFASGAKNCVFIGVIDGDYTDNNADDDLATVINSTKHTGPQMRALQLIPRANPGTDTYMNTSILEGTVIYDSSLHKLKVYTGSSWETITSA